VSAGTCALEACYICFNEVVTTGIVNRNDPVNCIYMNWTDGGSTVLDTSVDKALITGTIKWGIGTTYEQPIYEIIYFDYCEL